jgi:Rab proteins geranylgeranyltransferase component A
LTQFLELCRSRANGLSPIDINQNQTHSPAEGQIDSWIPLSHSSLDKIKLIGCSPEILEITQPPKPIQVRRSAEGSPVCYGYQMTHLPSSNPLIPGEESSSHTHPAFFGYQKDHRYNFTKLFHNSRYFNIDSLPKLLLSDGKMVEAIIASSVGNYLEFKSVDALYFLNTGQGKLKTTTPQLQRLPGSKADIFNSKMITALEKRSLMKVIQFAVDYGRRQEGLPVETLNENELAQGRALLRPQNKDSAKGLSAGALSIDQQPDKNFGDFLTETGVPGSLTPFVTYGLSLQSTTSCPSNTGLLGIYRHISASGRYGNTSFLVPVYGTSEFAQAFCRLSAVWGGIFILREDVSHFLTNQVTASPSSPSGASVTSVKLSNGRSVTCDFVVCEDATRWGSSSVPLKSEGGVSKRLLIRHSIFDCSLLPEESSQRGVAVLPAKLESLNNPHAVYVLQFDSSLSVAPSGLYVVYFLTYVDWSVEDSQDEQTTAANLLMTKAVQTMAGLCVSDEVTELLHATFLHPKKIHMTSQEDLPRNVFEAGNPSSDEHLLYIHESAVRAEQIFKAMCPDAPFLVDPVANEAKDSSHDPDEEGLSALLASAVAAQNQEEIVPNEEEKTVEESN